MAASRQGRLRSAFRAGNSRKVPVHISDLNVDRGSMESPHPLPLLAPGPPDALRRNSTLKSLRFNATPSKDRVERLDYAIKHIFVPPRLPSRADTTPQLESALFSLVRDSAESFKDCLEPGSDARAAWEMICTMLAASMKLYDGELTEDSVQRAISSRAPGGEMASAAPL